MNPRNNCNFIGRIPDTEKIKYEYHAGDGNKRSYISGAISVRRAYKPKDQQYYDEDLISFTAFGVTADYMNNYVKRGDTVALSGEFQNQKYQDNDGNSRSMWRLVVDSATSIGNKNNNSNNNSSSNNSSQNHATDPISNDSDNPFTDM